MKQTPSSSATDVERLVKLGHTSELAKAALSTARGDVRTATYLLSKGEITEEDKSWRTEKDDDWVNGISRSLPKHNQNRALVKSPIYVTVASWRRDVGDVILYRLHVILKDGRKWHIERRYSELFTFKSTLPLGTCFSFTNSFPMPSVFSIFKKELTSDDINKRYSDLAEWMREFVLNDSAMNSNAVLAKLYELIEIDKHGGRLEDIGKDKIGNEGAIFEAYEQAKHRNKSTAVRISSSPLAAVTSSNAISIASAVQRGSMLKAIPALTADRFHMNLASLISSVPFKVDTTQLDFVAPKAAVAHPGGGAGVGVGAAVVSESEKAATAIGMAFDLKQMAKDLGRDRIIVQGKRVLGAYTRLPAVVALCEKSILDIMTDHGHVLGACRDTGQSILSQYVDDFNKTAMEKNEHDAEGHVKAQVAGDAGKDTGEAALINEDIEKCEAKGLMKRMKETPLEILALSAMQLVSRTESAFLCHSSLYEIVDTLSGGAELTPSATAREAGNAMVIAAIAGQEDDEERAGDGDGVRNGGANSSCPSISTATGELLIVPVSSLSQPIELNFHIQENGAKWCIACEGEASTVFRVMDPENISQPLLQLRVTYVNTVFGMPQLSSGSAAVVGRGPASEIVNEFKVKKGKSYVVVQKDTTATSTDWNS